MKSKVEAQLAVISKLQEELNLLLTSSPEAESLEKENRKLAYQIDVLKRSIERERAELKPLKGLLN